MSVNVCMKIGNESILIEYDPSAVVDYFINLFTIYYSYHFNSILLVLSATLTLLYDFTPPYVGQVPLNSNTASNDYIRFHDFSM